MHVLKKILPIIGRHKNLQKYTTDNFYDLKINSLYQDYFRQEVFEFIKELKREETGKMFETESGADSGIDLGTNLGTKSEKDVNTESEIGSLIQPMRRKYMWKIIY